MNRRATLLTLAGLLAAVSIGAVAKSVICNTTAAAHALAEGSHCDRHVAARAGAAETGAAGAAKQCEKKDETASCCRKNASGEAPATAAASRDETPKAARCEKRGEAARLGEGRTERIARASHNVPVEEEPLYLKNQTIRR